MAETDKILFPCKDSFQFPIGYILMSASKINPATFLKYGEWALLGSGRTILGASDTDNGKETGGSFSKTLTSANIPGHTHSLPSHTHQIPAHNHTASSNKVSHNHNITVNSSGSHVHSLGKGGSHTHDWYTTLDWEGETGSARSVFSFVGGISRFLVSHDTAMFDILSSGNHSHSIGSAGSHTHTASSSAREHNHNITVDNKAAFNTASGGSGNSGSTGSGTSFDITPAYIKLFIWERIK